VGGTLWQVGGDADYDGHWSSLHRFSRQWWIQSLILIGAWGSKSTKSSKISYKIGQTQSKTKENYGDWGGECRLCPPPGYATVIRPVLRGSRFAGAFALDAKKTMTACEARPKRLL